MERKEKQRAGVVSALAVGGAVVAAARSPGAAKDAGAASAGAVASALSSAAVALAVAVGAVAVAAVAVTAILARAFVVARRDQLEADGRDVYVQKEHALRDEDGNVVVEVTALQMSHRPLPAHAVLAGSAAPGPSPPVRRPQDAQAAGKPPARKVKSRRRRARR